jgi:hypothetical protein
MKPVADIHRAYRLLDEHLDMSWTSSMLFSGSALQEPGSSSSLLHARKTKFPSLASFSPGSVRWQRVLHSALRCAGRGCSYRTLAFRKSYGRFVPFISAIPPLRMFIAAS